MPKNALFIVNVLIYNLILRFIPLKSTTELGKFMTEFTKFRHEFTKFRQESHRCRPTFTKSMTTFGKCHHAFDTFQAYTWQRILGISHLE